MIIEISLRTKNPGTVLQAGMDFISQSVGDNLEWKEQKPYGDYNVECDIPEEDIMPMLNKLVEKYPDLHIYARYSYDIREDDSSAQWWATTTIRTEHQKDGTTTLVRDSSTNWF